MPIGVTPDEEALRSAARALLARHCPPTLPRAAADAVREGNDVADPVRLWQELASAGLLGLAVPEEHGGSGAGLLQAAVVLEELGRALAPVPFVATVLAAAVVHTVGSDAQRKELLPGLADGTSRVGVCVGSSEVRAVPVGAGLRLTGCASVCLDAFGSDLVLTPVTVEGRIVWCLVPTSATAVRPLRPVDATRGLAEIVFDAVDVPAEQQLTGVGDLIRDLTAVLLSAEACGVASWCLDTAVAHARQRVQFGRPIGQFQAVKHRCADMLIEVEQARALAWDAARAWSRPEPEPAPATRLAAATAGALCADVAVSAAKATVQVLGGIGYTWEHDAHLYLRRAIALRQLLGSATGWHQRVAELALDGARRPLDLDVPAEAEQHREHVRALLRELDPLDAAQRQVRLAETGYLAPHWPPPYGRGAGPVEQLVIDEEFRRAKVRRPHLAVGAWALPTIIAHGTEEQQARWVGPTLRGALTWCQMFSEPGAGSDLAALSTKAVRVEGGWRVTGQKVWTSLAAWATHAILLARTAPGTAEDRRAGITYFVLDMTSEGIDVRPLRELTGQEFFNEVFLTDVFVPDADVVGDVGDGWRLTRTTLANERISMSSGATFGAVGERLLRTVAGHEPEPAVRTELGRLLTEAQSLALLGARSTQRALEGADPGAEASVRKLLGAEHEQRVQEFGLSLLGVGGATTEGDAEAWVAGFLSTRCLTIAGGTSEVQRNVVAERMLGLPRDPEPGE